jgi:5-methylthioadenosine/S-adenosylhomocysteine deaminase
MFRELRQAVLLQLITHLKADVMEHREGFRLGTEMGAKVLGIENLGRIDNGCLADIVAVRKMGNLFLTPFYDPLETLLYACSGGRDVAMTFVNGKLLYKDGQFKTVDGERIIARVGETSTRIRNSLPL